MTVVDDTQRRALREQPAIALALDLVERAAQELQRQDHEIERLHHLVEALLAAEQPLAVVEGTTVRGWSAGLERLTGTEAERALGRSLSSLLAVDVAATGGPGRWTDRTGRSWSLEGAAAGDALRVVRLRPEATAGDDDG
jgi:PAS domain-containing protein